MSVQAAERHHSRLRTLVLGTRHRFRLQQQHPLLTTGKCPFSHVSPRSRAACANTAHRHPKLYTQLCPALPSSSWLTVPRVCAPGTLLQRATVGTKVCRKRSHRVCKLLIKSAGHIVILPPQPAPQLSRAVALLCAAASSLPSATAASAAAYTPAGKWRPRAAAAQHSAAARHSNALSDRHIKQRHLAACHPRHSHFSPCSAPRASPSALEPIPQAHARYAALAPALRSKAFQQHS